MSTSYTYYASAAKAPVARGPVTPGLALLGGPPEGPPPEVDAAFVWLLAKSGWGRLVVMGADGSDEYARYIYGALPPPHPVSVETLIFQSREAASDPDVLRTVHGADALFIQGGDQSDYVKMWQGTPVQAAMNHCLERGVPLGGSSAGLAVLGEFLFSARNGSVSAAEALANPYDECVTLERALLDSPHLDAPYAFLRNLITDSHFHDRRRMGRLLTFMARLVADGWTSAARAIAVDELTAVLVEADGLATVVDRRPDGQRGSAWFLRAPGAARTCGPAQPLDYEGISVYRIRAGDGPAGFDLASWQGQGGEGTLVSARQGAVCPTILVE
jgi:cyanophycinase-like exopeptidase